MKDETSLELIEKYFDKSLAPSEMDDFNNKLATDREFALLFSNYQLAMKSAEHYGKIKMKERIKKIMDEEKNTRPAWYPNNWLKIAAVLIVLLTVSSPFIYNYYGGRQDYQELFNENFNLYPNVLNQRGNDLQNNLMLSEAMSYYSNKDFVNAVALMEELIKNHDSLAGTIDFYRGICLLGAGKDDDAADVFSNILAKPDESFKNQAKWYLALTYLKSGKREEAEELLKEISVEKAYNYLKAEKVLEELE